MPFLLANVGMVHGWRCGHVKMEPFILLVFFFLFYRSLFSVFAKGARKKSTKIKFLGPETARWGGGLPREGVVAENFVPALETLSSLGFEERNPGCPGNFAGMSRTLGGVQKVCAKKLRAHFSFPIILEPFPACFAKCRRQGVVSLT